ncbi:hypothetical protein F0562_023920 [Nyssa sinensis]|uniref:GTP-eEF1A C-terminal domain-containing protein n=1 Tax=Nyssa sinensis TaxID=561372 RepID=A0A5J5BJI1_9ASTE|nr:hypothetical protein F0562_023920 [Nyssa sinensis]
MGLNESFTVIRGQILLLDPLPSMNRVFAFVVQDEKQHEIKVNYAPSFDSIAAVTTTIRNSFVTTKNGNKQFGFHKDKSVCSHCGYTGHTSDKCYKIHGFPPGFKSKKANVHSANQVISSPADQENNELPQLAFTQEQRQQILSLINPPTKSLRSANQVSTASPLPSTSSGILPTPNIQYCENLSGKNSSIFSLNLLTNMALASVNSPIIPWIIDTGATDHMVNNLICVEKFSDFAQLGRFTLRTEGKAAAVGKVTDLYVASGSS